MRTPITRSTRLVLLRLPHRFNGFFSRTTWVSRYQKGKTSLDLNEARDDGVWGWQWHQLDHMQTTCTSVQTDNHTSTSSVICTARCYACAVLAMGLCLSVCVCHKSCFYRSYALPDAQPTAPVLQTLLYHASLFYFSGSALVKKRNKMLN